MAIAAENASTRQSSVSRTAAMVSGTSVSRNRMTGMASASPAMAPSPASTRLSIRNCVIKPAASRAERRAHRHFAAAHGAARHQQIRQVDARDQQDRRRRAEQHDQRRVASCPPALPATGVTTAERGGGTMFRRHAQAQRRHRFLGLLERHAGLEPRDAVHVVPPPVPQHRQRRMMVGIQMSISRAGMK